MLKEKRILSKIIMASLLCTSITTQAAFADGGTPKTPEQRALEIVSSMTTGEKIGQMLMPDFRTWNSSNLTTMNDEVAGVIKKYHLGGIILFAENIQGTEQTVRLTDGMQKAADKIPLLLTTDQEGGMVVRINGGTCMPGNMALGAAGNQDLTARVSKAMSEEVKALGINVDFAPDMDVNCNPDNPVIGVRSFGGEPDLVSRMGIAYINGAREAGVISTVKHFPGHGNVDVDSHIGLPLVNGDIDELNAVELKPFKAAIDGGVDMIMTAHIEVPALDSTTAVSIKDGSTINLPATLSKKILTGELRNTLGYKGVVVTDALNMDAIANNFGTLDAIERAVTAGADIPLMPFTIHRTSDIAAFDVIFNQLVNDADSGKLDMSRINESAQRIIALKIKRGIYDPDGTNRDTRTMEQKIAYANAVVGSAEHKAIEKEAANKAVTLLKNDNNILPFKMQDGQKILCMAPYNNRVAGFAEETRNIASKKGFNNVTIDSVAYSGSSCLDGVTQEKIKTADYIILGSYSYDKDSRGANADFVKYCNLVLDYANAFGRPVAVVSIENPYEINQMTNAKAGLAIYGYNYEKSGFSWQNIPAAVRVIFGEVNPSGKLPVAIPTADNKEVLYAIGYGLNFQCVIFH